MTTVTLDHNSGFFSCCSIRLYEIINYFNMHEVLPDNVDSSKQFIWYKMNSTRDITFDYFNHYSDYPQITYTEKVIYHHDDQFIDYSNVNYSAILPFIKKYFSPSEEINNIVHTLEEKYTIQYDKVCVLFYRGNDKVRETKLSSYDPYITYAKELLNKDPNITFFIQSDETEFIETMTTMFPNNSFYMKDEIRHIRKCNSSVDHISTNNDVFSKYYMAITIIMSKCKYIICGSGNCSIWIMFYREHNKNVYQYTNDTWVIS